MKTFQVAFIMHYQTTNERSFFLQEPVGQHIFQSKEEVIDASQPGI
jgi:hypothetical protein